jgi:hypothetical protein
MVNFYLGYKLRPKAPENRAEKGNRIDAKTTGQIQRLGEPDKNQFIDIPSVVENTTELLDTVPRVSKPTQ